MRPELKAAAIEGRKKKMGGQKAPNQVKYSNSKDAMRSMAGRALVNKSKMT